MGGTTSPTRRAAAAAIVLGAIAAVAACGGPGGSATPATGAAVTVTGPASGAVAGVAPGWHRDIRATVFWIGEDASRDNGGIANQASAWDEDWMRHFGGVDDPDVRHSLGPAFVPQENPFYVALPYNDFDEDGERRADARTQVPWAGATAWPADHSMVKNHWIELRAGDRVAYAQWEDVGPFLEDDAAYVFGTAAPRNTVDQRAGIDLSPSVRDALGVDDVALVDWRFVDAADVPAGPWTAVVTTSQITWR